jgi:hypothetical protein
MTMSLLSERLPKMNKYEMSLAILQMLNECAESQMREVGLEESELADGSMKIKVTWQIMGTEKTYEIQIKEVTK